MTEEGCTALDILKHVGKTDSRVTANWRRVGFFRSLPTVCPYPVSAGTRGQTVGVCNPEAHLQRLAGTDDADCRRRSGAAAAKQASKNQHRFYG
jgi:hypothetical protein